MMIVCPWCRRELRPDRHHPQELPPHQEEAGGSRTCLGSYSTPDEIRDLGDIRHRNGWDRKLPAHP